MSKLIKNLEKVKADIREAALECGRNPEEITLVAVSKTKPRAMVEEVLAHGHCVFGENKVQESEIKYNPPLEGIDLHMIGHLQSNKSRIVARLFHRIHSIDSKKIARRLDQQLGEYGRTMKGLIQVNLGQEQQKSGIEEAEVAATVKELLSLENLTIDGLMVLPPFSETPEVTEGYFRRLKELRDEINSGLGLEKPLKHLSMGMTADYRQAIRQGATFIRVGTAIFGKRDYPKG
jgi:pyridoxal phosphate enzyme (YggS family)